jgi:hypothetical protein
MATRVYRWRHLALLISILVIIIAAPLVAPLRHGVVILNVIGAAVLLAAVYAVSERKYLFATALSYRSYR